MKKESNYDITKRDALRRFLTYDTGKCADRLSLAYDENAIYVPFVTDLYALSRREESMVLVRRDGMACPADTPIEAGFNEILTVCDLLCHTEEPPVLSGDFVSLESLNRIMGGTSQSSLGGGFWHRISSAFDGHLEEVKRVCADLGATFTGKGDISCLLPITGPVSMLLRYYEADDEFPASLTLMFDKNICTYLYFETLWYAASAVLDRILERLA